MPRFFVRADQIEGGRITLTGEDALHISRSLRMREGEEITVCNMRRREYRCRLAGFTAETVECEILETSECESEPPYALTLYMALPKSDKMEWIIQKSVELGVTRIVPVRTERCIVKLDSKEGEKKRQRWQKIADNAAGQCGRGILPEVAAPMDFADAVAEGGAAGLPLFCYEAEEKTENALPRLLRATDPAAVGSIAVLVGAEGGFSVKEAESAVAAGWRSVTLGKRILRCETAPLFVLSAVSCALEVGRKE